MDHKSNPFSPGAGAPPPELVGRLDILQQAEILAERVLHGRAEKSALLTGLRGVGKTVLLNEIKLIATRVGMHPVVVEAQEGRGLADLLAPVLRTLLFDLDRESKISESVKRGLRVLRGWLGTPQITIQDVTFGLAYEPERGVADSGDLEADLPALFVAIAHAAQSRDTGVMLLIDEIQYLDKTSLSALIVAMHRLQQEQLPFALVGAGLPTLPGLAGDAKSYAERLFSYPRVGALNQEDSYLAVRDPISALGFEVTDEALTEIFVQTLGFPYFLQEWGYRTWLVAEGPTITLSDVKRATPLVIQQLDDNFFRVRYDRLTPAERRYLRAMAELGAGPYRAADVAEVLGVKQTTVGVIRGRLIHKGMIYSPAHGDIAFTVPLFDQFMRRAIPDFQPTLPNLR